MGLALSLFSKLGLASLGSLSTDQIYDGFFKDVKDFHQFHTACITLFKFLNDVMPGKHFGAEATKEKIEEFYEKQWKPIGDESERKKNLIEFVKENVKEDRPNDNAVIMAGLVVPAAAVMVKNSTENIPAVKQFKLHLIPNFIFVPTVTLLALAGVQIVKIGKKKPS